MATNGFREIDPNYSFPEELVGFQYKDEDDVDLDFSDDTVDDSAYEDDDNSLDPPSNIRIVKQTIRKKQGKNVVDVVIEIADDDDTEYTYDKKITKETVDPDDYVIVQDEDV